MKSTLRSNKDIVAVWNIPLSDGLHRVEFEHGTSTGKRIVRVGNKEVIRKGWVFNLVGQEHFFINNLKCIITIEAVTVFSYQYTLSVGGKPFDSFVELMRKLLKLWEVLLDDQRFVICLEKDKLNVLINGVLVDSKGEFVETGTVIHFLCHQHPCSINVTKATKKKEGVVYNLYIDGKELNELQF